MLNLLDKQRVQRLAETIQRVGWPRSRAVKIGVLYFEGESGPNPTTIRRKQR